MQILRKYTPYRKIAFLVDFKLKHQWTFPFIIVFIIYFFCVCDFLLTHSFYAAWNCYTERDTELRRKMRSAKSPALTEETI